MQLRAKKSACLKANGQTDAGKQTNIASSSPAAVRDQEKTQEEDRQQNI